MAVEAKQYLLFLRPTSEETTEQTAVRRSEGLPDEGDSVAYTNANRLPIISTVNYVFQQGITQSFPHLPLLLAPSSHGLYSTAIRRSTFNTRVLVLWQKLTPSQQRRHNAAYQLSFHVPSQVPSAAVDLAYFLLSFTYNAIRTYVTMHYDYDVHKQPTLKGLAYHLRPSGSTGVAFFDFIDDVYQNAMTMRASYPQYTSFALSGRLVTTLPPNDPTLLTEDFVRKCVLDSRALARTG